MVFRSTGALMRTAKFAPWPPYDLIGRSWDGPGYSKPGCSQGTADLRAQQMPIQADPFTTILGFKSFDRAPR